MRDAKRGSAVPRTGERVRSGTLPRVDGGAFPLRHMGREATVLIRTHGAGCDECLRYLAALDARGGDLWDGRLAAVVPGSGEDTRSVAGGLEHVTVLSDPEGRGPLAEADGAALVIFDRYAQVYHTMEAGAGHDLPPVEEVREWLKFLATQCPECGVPDQP